MTRLIVLVVALGFAVPASAQSPMDVINSVAERGGLAKCGLGDDPESNRGCGIFTRLVVIELHRAGLTQFELLTKAPGENNYQGFAVDAIIDRIAMQRNPGSDCHCVYDIIARGGSRPVPSFHGPEGRRLHNVNAPPVALSASDLAFVGWGSAPTPPLPPAVDLSAVLARLAALENAIEGLRADTSDIRAVLKAEATDIRAIIAALPTPTIACKDLPPYRGSFWLGSITSHPQCR